MLPQITMEGRLVADPELRFLPSGMAVASFRAVAAKRKKDDDGKWVDDKATFLTVTTFKQLAENVAESLQKGDVVLVQGALEQDDYEDRNGDKRTSYKILANVVAASLQFRTIPHGAGKAERSGGAPPADDPWASVPPPTDEPPY